MEQIEIAKHLLLSNSCSECVYSQTRRPTHNSCLIQNTNHRPYHLIVSKTFCEKFIDQNKIKDFIYPPIVSIEDTNKFVLLVEENRHD